MRGLLLLLFSISGFTGLIYESIWSHYLKLFLGHASYAQALVLVIFMGGMASGAWLVSRKAKDWSNLLMIYAIIEGIIGIFGLAFHFIFQLFLNISYDTVIPLLGTPNSIHFYKWSMSALLILPQSILLGMTFPLMSNGIIRRFSQLPGNSISMLYFTNSIGAAIGVLVSGFYLIKLVGLPGTIMTAGILNILLAITVYGLIKKTPEEKALKNESVLNKNFPVFMLVAAFITGTASFIYEITWIRMLNMVLGSGTHAFELMLSAFITGIAFGSLWIRKRIDHLTNLIQASGYIQIIMGVLALATIPLYNHTFKIMEFFMTALERTNQGYQLFTLTEHFIALLVMLPATFFAGMTLPLFSLILLKQGYGERSIGQVYASNTLGAIFGVLFTIFIGMPFLGLKGSILLGCSLDIILGISLLAISISVNQPKKVAAVSIVCLVFILTVLFGTQFDTRKMASGVYRTGKQYNDNKMETIYYRDGRTASISINDSAKIRTIATNGKSDASINMSDKNGPTIDEGTMVLLGSLPLIFKPDAKTVANIGMGSGLTAHTVLLWPEIQTVDTIEIEPMVIEAAKTFRPRVDRTFTDPRSHIYIEDAKTYFSTYQKKYDVIISEPSNPWVSGVSSLFTDEFYEQILNHLNDEGMFVQWLQLYEINEQLIFSILRALSNHFYDFKIFASVDYDLIIVASKNNIVPEPSNKVFLSNELKMELEKINVRHIQDIYARYLGGKKLYYPYLLENKLAENSDYFPIVDLGATRAMFLADTVTNFITLKMAPVPILSTLAYPEIIFEETEITPDPYSIFTLKTGEAKKIYNHITTPQTGINVDLLKYDLLTDFESACLEVNSTTWIDILLQLMNLTLPYLQPSEITEITQAINPDCSNAIDNYHNDWLQLYAAIGQRDANRITDIANVLLKNSSRWSYQQLQFLFTANFLGLVAIHEYASAVIFWNLNVNKFYNKNIPFNHNILYAIAKYNLKHPYKAE